jgi:hypothetical protein
VEKILLLILLISLPAICLAQEKVVTNDDLRKGPTPPPPFAQPGTVVVTPPPPAAPINVNSPVQRQPFPIQNPNILVRKSTPATPAVKIPQVIPQKSYNPATSLVQALAAAFAGFTLLMLLAVGIPFLIVLICLIDILRNEFTGHNKIIWILLVLFLPLLGSILYFFIGIDQKVRPAGEEELL